ncbi:helix-turn-helix transcriptional regulator [Streptomyces sp. NPDC001941]|uniref:helix-turn-helix domain-containing protein n=1 Tax=Streptomyces sp. NPDC001941 TaxID=3154659 RepID=UPI00331D6200
MTESHRTGSTVPRRQLGRHLAQLRKSARYTVRSAARYLEWSEAKMWRIESGQTSLRSLDVEAMCRLYGAEPEITQALMGLAKETKARGWWHAYGEAIPESFDLYIGLEEAASHLDTYERDLVPGLLQTADYARAIINAGHPTADESFVAARVALRVARQVLLTRVAGAPLLRVLLDEAVLRRQIGSKHAMGGQLRHLMEMGRLPHVTIRIVPFAAGLHLGVLSGPYTVLRFPTNGDGTATEPDTVYTDGFTGALYLDKEAETAKYRAAYQATWDAALSEHESTALITETAGSYA